MKEIILWYLDKFQPPKKIRQKEIYICEASLKPYKWWFIINFILKNRGKCITEGMALDMCALWIRKALCYTAIDFKYRFHSMQLGYLSFLKINIGSREKDLEVNTTYICKIIAVYWPKPLKALQTTALLDSSHRIIDSLLSPRNTVAQALFSVLNTGQKAPFHYHCSGFIRHPSLCCFGREGGRWKVPGTTETDTSDSEVCLVLAQRLHLRCLLCPCTGILTGKNGLQQPVYAMVTSWFCLQMRKSWSLSFLSKHNKSTDLFSQRNGS